MVTVTAVTIDKLRNSETQKLRKKMKKIILLLVLTVMTLSCQSQSDPKIKVLPTEAYKVEIAKGNVQIVDVRTPDEFSEGAIPNALNINVNDEAFEAEIQNMSKEIKESPRKTNRGFNLLF